MHSTGHQLLFCLLEPRRASFATFDGVATLFCSGGLFNGQIYKNFGLDYPHVMFFAHPDSGPDGFADCIAQGTAKSYFLPPFGFRLKDCYSSSIVGNQILKGPAGHILILPLWPAVLIGFSCLTALPWIRWVLRQRSVVEGRCHSCGYDLRATPRQCPECGQLSRTVKGTHQKAFGHRPNSPRRLIGILGTAVSIPLWLLLAYSRLNSVEKPRVLLLWAGQKANLVGSIDDARLRLVWVRRIGSEESNGFKYDRMADTLEECAYGKNNDDLIEIGRPLGSMLWPNFGFWVSRRTEFNVPMQCNSPRTPIAHSIWLQIPNWFFAVAFFLLALWPQNSSDVTKSESPDEQRIYKH